MSVTEGLDPVLVREISAQLRRSADDTTDVRATGDVLTRLLDGLWRGHDAVRLLEDWHRLAPVLDESAEATREAAERLRGQVERQEETSAGVNAAPGAMPFAPTARAAGLSEDAAQRWVRANDAKTNEPWDVNPETGTAMVNGRNVPNWEFGGRTYGGPEWSEESAEETGPEWTVDLQERYPDGVVFTDAAFPLFYPYVHPDHEPVVIELTNSSSKDIRLAYEAAGIDRETAKELQRDWVWHHTHVYDPETDEGELILIPRDLHAAVKHAGGRSLHKHTGGESD